MELSPVEVVAVDNTPRRCAIWDYHNERSSRISRWDVRSSTVGEQMQAARCLRALAGLLSVAAAAAASATEIHVYSSGAPATAARVIATDFAKKNNDHFEFTVAQPAVIQADLAAGEKADVVILPRPLVTTLTGSGVLRNDSAVTVARVGIGIVVRAGAPTPNIADVAAIRQLLRDAPSIVYPDPAETGGGSAGLAVARMIDRLGLTDIVRPK